MNVNEGIILKAYVYSNGEYGNLSDERFKENIIMSKKDNSVL